MNVGDPVFHQDFGRGSIVRLYPEGPTAMVDFGYMTDLIPLTRLTGISPDASPLSVAEPQVASTSAPPLARPPASTQRPRSVETPPVQSAASVAEKPKKSRTHVTTSANKPGQDPSANIKPHRSGPAAALKQSVLTAETIDARRAIVALRLGQVLETHVDHLSVGLDEVARKFEASLGDARKHHPVYIMIEGAWGQGKTHLLTLLRAAAVRHQFAVSSVVMDGVGVTLSDPMQLLEAITAAIRFPGENVASGLANRIASARRSGNLERLAQLGATTLAKVFDHIPHTIYDEFDALQVIEDYLGLTMTTSNANYRLKSLGYPDIRLPPLRARAIIERAARFADLLFNWTQFCAVTGARGLVIILDELDVEYASTSRGGQQQARLRHRRQELLEALGRLRSQGLPLMVAFASAPAGPDVEPEHDASIQIPEIVGALEHHIIAPSPNDEGLRDLITKVLALYRQAYPETAYAEDQNGAPQLSGRLIDAYHRQPNPVPRYFLRSALESLDLLSFQAR